MVLPRWQGTHANTHTHTHTRMHKYTHICLHAVHCCLFQFHGERVLPGDLPGGSPQSPQPRPDGYGGLCARETPNIYFLFIYVVAVVVWCGVCWLLLKSSNMFHWIPYITC